jgi:hypothetical protein
MITKRELERLYIENRLSTNQICGQLGVSRGSVKYWMKRYGIKGRSPKEAYRLVIRPQKHKRHNLDANVVRHLYWDKNLSISEVAKELGSGYCHVRHKMVRSGIPRRSPVISAKMRDKDRKGNGYIRHGYRYIWISKRQIVPEHRHIASLVLGRPLKRNEHVHHINGDKLDNRNINLIICSQSYHQLLHAKEEAAALKEWRKRIKQSQEMALARDKRSIFAV